MFLSRPRLLWLIASIILLIPISGCEKDRDIKVQVPREVTSPYQVSEWLEQLRAVIRATHVSGPEASRILAYSSIAYYEGYSLGFDDMRSLVEQLDGLDELPTPNPNLVYNYGVIAESAMTTCLLRLFEDAPQNIQMVISSTYREHERAYIRLGVAQSVIDRSRALGEVMGEAIKVWMDGDGYAELADCEMTMPSGSENWQLTPGSGTAPEFPCWGNLRAFTFTDGELITLCNPGIPEPVSMQSGSAYNGDINELVTLSGSLTAEQQEIALFWNDGEENYTVPGHYISIMEQLVGSNLLNGKQTVTAWTQLCIAMADTYISTYRLKYTYTRPRPLTVIRQNVDPNWNSFATNPATPEYPSLRATIAYSATQVFVNLYGNIGMTDRTHTNFGLAERSYDSFTSMAQEAAQSRMYAGTNLRSTLSRSEYHGRCIAQRANELFLNN